MSQLSPGTSNLLENKIQWYLVKGVRHICHEYRLASCHSQSSYGKRPYHHRVKFDSTRSIRWEVVVFSTKFNFEIRCQSDRARDQWHVNYQISESQAISWSSSFHHSSARLQRCTKELIAQIIYRGICTVVSASAVHSLYTICMHVILVREFRHFHCRAGRGSCSRTHLWISRENARFGSSKFDSDFRLHFAQAAVRIHPKAEICPFVSEHPNHTTLSSLPFSIHRAAPTFLGVHRCETNFSSGCNANVSGVLNSDNENKNGLPPDRKYAYLVAGRRQPCLSHQLRSLRFLSERAVRVEDQLSHSADRAACFFVQPCRPVDAEDGGRAGVGTEVGGLPVRFASLGSCLAQTAKCSRGLRSCLRTAQTPKRRRRRRLRAAAQRRRQCQRRLHRQ